MLVFDFFIVAILLMSVISGLYRGVYKQLSTTFSLVGAFAVVYFAKEMVLDVLASIGLFGTVVEITHKIFRFVANVTVDEMANYVVFLLLFIVAFLVVRMLFTVFSPSRRRVVLKNVSSASRFIGGAFGVVSGYAIIMLTLILIKPITEVDYTTPITNIVISINEPLQNELGDVYFDQFPE